MKDLFGFARIGADMLYDSKANVYVTEKSDEDTVFAEDALTFVKRYSEQPCRISQKTVGASNDGVVGYETKLFIAPELNIPAGSRIEVTDIHGNVDKYKNSSDSFDSYTSHQEITLAKDDWT